MTAQTLKNPTTVFQYKSKVFLSFISQCAGNKSPGILPCKLQL
uniref:Uncharacterized protein n=1 Tax=Arundo donax TaxID=35708 RepID=A0A0A9BZW0_ARUDO